jgi:hypothetical protein
MTKLQQGSVGGEAQRRRLRDSAGLLASGLAHGLLLLGIVLFGSPRLLATTAPEPIVVDIVKAEEIPKGTLSEPSGTKESEQEAQQQQAQQQVEQQKQAQAQPPPSQQPGQSPSKVQVASVTRTAPVFTSLYPWPVAQPDVQDGDYRTFESM